MATNTGGDWKRKPLTVFGFGRGPYGSVPYGQRALAFHLGSVSFPEQTAADGLNASSTWALSTSTDSWVDAF